MRTSFYFWLVPALALSASAAFFGCAKEPLSLGEDGTADGGEPGGLGASSSGGKTGGSSNGGSSSGGSSSTGIAGASAVVCAEPECGPQLGRPNELCEDGSTAGPTGRCLRGSDGTCGWEVLECPVATGEGGATNVGGMSSMGGTLNGGGAPGNGGAGGTRPDECSGCFDQGQICIYQVGGPGPSHFTCATQLPCGAAGACACIQGQGTCDMALAADGYCHCDNGVE